MLLNIVFVAMLSVVPLFTNILEVCAHHVVQVNS